MSKSENKTAADMTEAMEKTMQRLEGRFQAISEQLESKTGQHVHFLAGLSFTVGTLDEMGTRIVDLEKNVAELMTQAGMEEQAMSK